MNNWISWSEQEQLPEYYLMYVQSSKPACYERIDVVLLGRMPEQLQDDFLKYLKDNIPSLKDLRLFTWNSLEYFPNRKKEVFRALKLPCLVKKHITRVFQNYENEKKEIFILDCNAKYSGSITSSTQSDSAPASGTVDDKGTKPKEGKQRGGRLFNEEVLEVCNEIKRIISSTKTKDISQESVILKLKEKFGKRYDLSPKTKAGKMYAVAYYKKFNKPPVHWKEYKVKELIENMNYWN